MLLIHKRRIKMPNPTLSEIVDELDPGAPQEQERYYEYMLRRLKEDREKKEALKTDRENIISLSDRVKKLEIDMAHLFQKL
tara:strand:- start:1808 stop:2050 length:243 start_codon:yes stop_codon:yes gene_type:complete